MPRGIWKTVETSARKIRVGKIKRRRSKRGKRREKRRERVSEELEKGEEYANK